MDLMVTFDSRSYYYLYVRIHLIATIIAVFFLTGALGVYLVPAVLMIVAWHQTKERYYVGLNLHLLAVIILFIFNILFPPWWGFSYVIYIEVVNILIFYYLVINEARILKRPIFDLNDEEAERARKAFKTRDPVDIENISKLKPWGDSLKVD